MNTTTSTKDNLNTLIGFRQAVYEHVFRKRRDALFDTLDALLYGGTLASLAYLSQSKRFLYAAVEDGQIDPEALRRLLIGQLPQKGVCVFQLDSSSWARARNCLVKDPQVVYQVSSDVDGGNITIGYPYPGWNGAPKRIRAGRCRWTWGALRAHKRRRIWGLRKSRHWPKPVQTARRRWILSRRMENTAMDAFCPA